jgi:hypothetical protein
MAKVMSEMYKSVRISFSLAHSYLLRALVALTVNKISKCSGLSWFACHDILSLHTS